SILLSYLCKEVVALSGLTSLTSIALGIDRVHGHVGQIPLCCGEVAVLSLTRLCFNVCLSILT
ncbi:MAG: hypothetical protein ACKO90_05390, partial [Microcystis panniformis]